MIVRWRVFVGWDDAVVSVSATVEPHSKVTIFNYLDIISSKVTNPSHLIFQRCLPAASTIVSCRLSSCFFGITRVSPSRNVRLFLGCLCRSPTSRWIVVISFKKALLLIIALANTSHESRGTVTQEMMMNPRNVARWGLSICDLYNLGVPPPYQMADISPSHYQFSIVCLEMNPITKGWN